jgi:RNA polymerase sigma-70 factor (ECF subfamily)
VAITTEPAVGSDEQALVQLARQGNQLAFADLVERHQAVVFGTALRLLRDRDVAAEVANRAFYRAYEHLNRFDASRPLRPWLVRIVANEALNELRSRRRDAGRTVGGEAAAIELEQVVGGPDPAELLSQHQRSAAIRAAIDRLPEAQRLVVVLRYFADLSYADIAEATQQTVTNVGVILLRARDRLRRELETEGVTSDGSS